MRNCAHLFLSALGTRLGQAADDGVKRLSFTGHSLGGMYAQVCILLFHQFQENRLPAHLAEHIKDLQEAPNAVNLLREATSITFGSPMVLVLGIQHLKKPKHLRGSQNKKRSTTFMHMILALELGGHFVSRSSL